jgi:uncharacterized protein
MTDRPIKTKLPGDPGNPLRGLKEVQGQGKDIPPVHLWNPPFCGDIGMRIAADGTWFYMNSPIGRKPLVKLFSSILRHDEDGRYYLVTPVEKCSVEVEDAPLVAIAMSVRGEAQEKEISFVTNAEDEVTVDAIHPLRFAEEEGTQGLKPYVLVRGRLEALVSRPIFYDLVAQGVVERVEGDDWFGVWSKGQFWPMQRAREIGLKS